MSNHTSTITSSNLFRGLATKKDMWSNSLMEPIKRISSPKAKGSVGEKLVTEVMSNLGHRVTKPKSTDYDRMIDGHRCEIKLSCAWDDAPDNWCWQQIRDQEYDRIIFVGINPDGFHLWWATKADLEKYVIGRNECRQHAGKDGGQELYWLRGPRQGWFKDMESF
jgi:hypothetical protein